MKNLAETMWHVTTIVINVAVVAVVVILVKHHVTCVDFFNTWCVIN